VAASDLHVSPLGDDHWQGQLPAPNADRSDGPFATLEGARDALRRAGANIGPGTRTVWIHGGIYFLDKTFELLEIDSGTALSPIVYRAIPGEKVRITGGRRISGFHPLEESGARDQLPEEARNTVVAADLRKEGVTGFGSLTVRGFGRDIRPAGLELFFNEEPMQLARWPNSGWAKIAAVPEGATSGKFLYEGDRPERWKNAPDLWLHGVWFWDWADSYIRVAAIDLSKKEVQTAPPHDIYGYKAGKRFYALNLLEELDQPGEWYLDREIGVLYFWPPAPIEKGEAWISETEKLVSFKGVSGVTLRGLVLECCRGDAVTLTGGARNRVAGCLLRNIGNRAVVVNGGTEDGVESCDIHFTGDGGIDLSGGDRKTLNPGGNFALNNHIHDYSRWCMTYRPGVMISGVGNRVAHNWIHDAPHNAIQLMGNEHVIEYNHIHDVCRDTGDVGAFYMGRDWSQRGNVVRFNFFHHLGGLSGVEGWIEAMAIYLDDWASGTTVYGNVCYKAGRAVLIGGGRDNRVENNLFVDCTPAIHVDSRGLGWAKNYFDGGLTTLTDRLTEVNYRQPPYSERYPELLSLYEDEPAVAKGNRILRNVFYQGRWLDLTDGLDEKVVEFQDNFTEGDPGIVDAEGMDFRLKNDSPAWKLGFQPLPHEEMGILDDELRRELGKLSE
jgi:hypothetical protein